MLLPAERVSQRFGRAAQTYDAHAIVQHEVLRNVAVLVDQYVDPNQMIVDVGCGTSALAALMPAYHMLGIDRSEAMCHYTRTHRHRNVICGDAMSLPIAANACEAYVSSLCWQWVEPQIVVKELQRVLSAQGVAVISILTFGTFAQMHDVLLCLQLPMRLLPCHPAQIWREAFHDHALKILHNEVRSHDQYFPSSYDFLKQLRAIGATTSGQGEPISVKDMKRLIAYYDAHYKGSQGVRVSYQVGYWVVTYG